MNRRNFIQRTALLSTFAPFAQTLANGIFSTADNLPEWILAMAPQADESIERHLNLQSREKGPNFGGVADYQRILNPQGTAGLVRIGACGLYMPNSRYHRSTDLITRMLEAMDYLLSIQHEDGTIDLLSTNFHSTPDTGFIVKRLANAWRLIDQLKMKETADLQEKIKTFLQRAADALVVGGIHTPNHRWVVSGALASVYGIWPERKYLNRIEDWLAEGIDLDPDGQYNERSTYIYSSLTNRVLISVAHYTGKTHLLEYVRKNLDMTRYYIHPNAEIVTDASGRQDKATIGMFENYYYPYRYMAIQDKNEEYAGMCRFIEATAGRKIAGHLDYYLAEPLLWRDIPQGTPPPTSYVKELPYSGLVRVREGNWDASIISKNSTWLTFMHGNAVIQGVRVASSFFGKGQFVTDKIERIPDGWKLTQSLEGPYYQPLPRNLLPGDGDWAKMPRIHRPQSEIQKLETTIYIQKTPEGISFDVTTKGCERVPLAIEIIFREGGQLQGVEAVPNVNNSWILPSGMGTYTVGNDKIQFGPGLGLHLNTALRGSLPHTGSPSVYLTGFTPFNHTVRLEAVK